MTTQEQHLSDLEQIKKFRLLDDDFMNKFFEEQPQLVAFVLRIILNDETIEVKEHLSQTQYVIKGLQGHDIALDIHAVSENLSEYNVEVQRSKLGAAARRARRNHSFMDANCKNPGKYGINLPESYVIVFTETDIHKGKKPMYVVRKTMDGITPYDDGSHTVYINGAYKGTDTELGKLIHDFRCTEAKEMFFSNLADRARYLKETEEGVANMCEYMEKRVDEAKNAMILNMFKEKCTVEFIAKISEKSIEYVSNIGKNNGFIVNAN